jgi:hypothetical protein
MPAGLVAAGLLMICSSAMASGNSQAASRQVIIDWNKVAQANIGGQPFSQTRSYAMVHIAMADAVIAVEGDFEPFHVELKSVPHGASAKAAAAQAARDVLVALIPANQATFDSALATSLANIPSGQRMNGSKIGKKVAQKVLEWRQNDGFSSANPQPADFLASTLPGIWRQTVSGPAQYSALGSVEPFGLLAPTQFLPVPPPQLESDEYAADYNEVKDKGRATGSTRSEDETRLAQLVASAPGPYANATSPFRLWSNVAIDLANSEHLSLVRTARMFALLTASIHDSLQTSHSSKFTYRLWRPENAVAGADIDDNPDTTSEIGWVPLLTTPPYPSHSSNMSCIGSGAAQMMANVFGTDNKPFTARWFTGGDSPALVYAIPYNNFWGLGQDQGSSRIYGGLHYRFEITASDQACSQVANYLFDNYMQRSKRH